MDPARQRGVEMRHQRHVVAVVPADIVEAVAEILSPRELLFENREATAERMAAGIDDPRVRQRQVNQSDVHEVVRHLVDEERRARLALHARALQVLLAHRTQLGCAHGAEYFRILQRRVARPPRLEAARQRDHVVQLHRAFDHGMARQDLLDQRRSGARQPDYEDRIARRAAGIGASVEKLARQQIDGPAHGVRMLVGTVVKLFAVQTISLGIVLERRVEPLLILARLAQRELEMQPVFGRQVRERELRLHRLDVGGCEAKRLEVCKTPVGFAEIRRQLDALAVGPHALFLPPRSLQYVPEAEPHLRLARILGKDSGVKIDGLAVFADADEHVRLEVAMARVVRLGGQHRFDLPQRLTRPVLAVEHGRIMGSGRRKARSELETAHQQIFRIRVTPEPRSYFRKHADRSDIGRMLFQMGAQQRLGHRDVVLAQGSRGFQQARIACRCLDVPRIGNIGTGRIADRGKMIGQRTPRPGELGAERYCTAQCYDRCLAVAGVSQCKSVLIVHSAGVGLRSGQRLECGQGGGRFPLHPLRRSDYESGNRVAGDRLQDPGSLLQRQVRPPLEQAKRVGKRHVHRTNGVREALHRTSTLAASHFHRTGPFPRCHQKPRRPNCQICDARGAGEEPASAQAL